MLFFDGPVENDALTTFVRGVPFDSNLGLTNLFGRRDTETNTVDFAEIVRTNRMARYRSFDGRVHVSARDTGSEKRIPLLPLSSSLNMGEFERLQLQFAALQGGNTARLAQAVYNDAGYMLTSNLQIRNMRRNKQVIDAVFGSTGGRTQVSLAELRGLLADEFNITLLNAYDSSFDVDGVTTRTLPNDKVAFLPADLDNFGFTAWGVSATALALVQAKESDMTFEEAAGIVGIIDIGPSIPYRQQVQVDGVALPIIADARGLSILDVIP
jgi:hypothetical protein